MYVLFQKVTSSEERIDNGFKDWDEDQDEDRIERLHLVWLKNELAQPSIHTSGLQRPPRTLHVCVCMCVCGGVWVVCGCV